MNVLWCVHILSEQSQTYVTIILSSVKTRTRLTSSPRYRVHDLSQRSIDDVSFQNPRRDVILMKLMLKRSQVQDVEFLVVCSEQPQTEVRFMKFVQALSEPHAEVTVTLHNYPLSKGQPLSSISAVLPDTKSSHGIKRSK